MKKLLITIPLLFALVACNNESPELPGVFTIDKNKRVQFSPGLLKYRASTNTWRFADSQLEIVGEGNTKISPTYNGWIDLFGYGCTGYDGKYPWQTSTNREDYAPAFGNGITSTEYDWGVYCDIQNGGPKGSWHLMNAYNWYYLAEARPNARKLMTYARIDGHYGILILPDNWENTLNLNMKFSEVIYEYEYDFWNELADNNTYTKSEWKQLEKTGAVFIPTVDGYRKGKEISPYGCYYWFGNSWGDGAEPWVLDIIVAKAGVHIDFHEYSIRKNPDRGFYVRLVKDVK